MRSLSFSTRPEALATKMSLPPKPKKPSDEKKNWSPFALKYGLSSLPGEFTTIPQFMAAPNRFFFRL